MKQVNLGYDVLVTYKTLLQSDIVDKDEAVAFAKDLFYDNFGIELHDDEIELVENIVTVEK